MAKQYVLQCDMCGNVDTEDNRIVRVYVLKVGRDLCALDRLTLLSTIGIDEETAKGLVKQQETDADNQRGRGRKPKGQAESEGSDTAPPPEGSPAESESVTEGDGNKSGRRGRKGQTAEAQPA